jgi:lipopolysaccharide/colanic/teichoic acid biosynthesis glycosyltransferase
MLNRVFDLFVSSISIFVLAVPLALVALTVKIFDGGPVFYRQVRIGRNGKPFWFYKFRTMKVSTAGSLVTTKGDPRVTRIGQVLRCWKLDELPQLWNILRGDMGVVGPRPEAERLVHQYTVEQQRILEITPGLAGMSQLVYPHEAELLRRYADPEEFYVRELMPRKIAVDLEYQRTRTFLTDLGLLGKLLLLIVFGRSRHTDHDLDACAAVEMKPGADVRGVIATMRNIAKQQRRQ